MLPIAVPPKLCTKCRLHFLISMHSALPKDHVLAVAALTEGGRYEDARFAARHIHVAAGAVVVAAHSDTSAAVPEVAVQVVAEVVRSLQAWCTPLATVAVVDDDAAAAAVGEAEEPRRYCSFEAGA